MRECGGTRCRWRPFHSLQWKLTLGYTALTMAAILLLELAGLLAIRAFTPWMAGGYGRALVRDLRTEARQVAPLMADGAYDRKTLTAWFQDASRLDRTGPPPRNLLAFKKDSVDSFRVILDYRGEIVATSGDAPPNFPQAVSSETVQTALAGDTDRVEMAGHGSLGGLLAAAPIIGRDGGVLGALVLFLPRLPGFGGVLATILSWRNALLIATIAGLIGALFGFFTARWLNRRLRILARVTDAWGRGDFSILVPDRTDDELGDLAGRLNGMAGQLRELLRTRAQLAVLEERNRLARDLHDSVNQEIYGVMLYAKAAAQNLARGEADKAGGQLADLLATAQQAMREMRLLIFELHPLELEQKGLAAALKARLESVEDRIGLETELMLIGEVRPPAVVERELYHVAQEALNNALKHAHASRIKITVRFDDDETGMLEVADDGIGFNPVASRETGGFGLKGMEERLAALGGSLTISSTPGGGTVIRAQLPGKPRSFSE